MSDSSRGPDEDVDDLVPSSVLDEMLAGLGFGDVPVLRTDFLDEVLEVDDEIDDRYVVGELVFRGPGVALHRGFDRVLDRPVALKAMGPDEFGAMREVARVELLLARSVSHPHICRVHDVVVWRGLHVLVIEDVHETLRTRLGAWKAGDWAEVDDVRSFFAGLASAIALIHQQGLVHGAINPDNILLQGDTAKLLFGPATTRERLVLRSKGGLATLDPAYYSPERLVDGHTSRWDDAYALGLVLWELLSRRPIEMGASPRSEPMLSAMPVQVVQALSVDELRTLFDMLSEGLTQRPPARRLRLGSVAKPRATTGQEIAGTPPPSAAEQAFDPERQSLLVTFAESPRLIGTLVPLTKPELSIGRAGDIVVGARSLSKEHARLAWAGGVWRVTDLGSTNGTFQDSSYESKDGCILRHAEEVQLAQVRLRLVSFRRHSVEHWQARHHLRRVDGLTGFLHSQHFVPRSEEEAEFADWTGLGSWILRVDIQHGRAVTAPVALLATRRAAVQARLVTTSSWPGCVLFGVGHNSSAPVANRLGCVLVGRNSDEPERLVERLTEGTRRMMPRGTTVSVDIFRREHGEPMADVINHVLS